MSSTKTVEKPIHHIRLGCLGNECGTGRGVYHDIHVPCDDFQKLLREFNDWAHKHSRPSCRVPDPQYLRRDIPRDFDGSEFDKQGFAPWWIDPSVHGLRENTNFQVTYVANAAFTVTSWATLASDASLLAGASSATVDLGATGAPLQVEISAQIKNGTTPTTAKEIDIYAWSKLSGSSTFPDAITGSDAAISISSATALVEALSPVVSFASTTTTGATYPTGWHTLRNADLGSILGGFLSRFVGLWIVHNSVAAFASGSAASYDGLYVVG